MKASLQLADPGPGLCLEMERVAHCCCRDGLRECEGIRGQVHWSHTLWVAPIDGYAVQHSLWAWA